MISEELNNIFNIINTQKVIDIKVITRSSVNKIYFENNIVKVKIREVPEDGKANIAVIDVLSKNLKIAKSNIKIISGFTNSHKKVCFDMEKIFKNS